MNTHTNTTVYIISSMRDWDGLVEGDKFGYMEVIIYIICCEVCSYTFMLLEYYHSIVITTQELLCIVIVKIIAYE